MGKKAIIIGAGPAGLTAAYELLKRTDITPIILEKSGDIGGISKTINYKGNRMDIGGHRFFSKSDRVMNWWCNIMPTQPTADSYTTITYQRNHRTIKQEETHSRLNHEDESKMMLIRKRLSRIYFLRKFFTYPIQLSLDTLRKLGPFRTLGILTSYIKAHLFPRKPERSLEDFLINRFGVKLYLLFFKDYTEKVWGVHCNKISAEWGAQRIKGVSISKALKHAAQTMMKKNKINDIRQKDTETSLIEQFLYPALGPGQLWEEVARQVQEMGGTIIMNENVKEITTTGNKVTGVICENKETGEQTNYTGDYFFSTMPVQELIAGMNGQVPANVKEIAAGLQYRDFITIVVLLKKLTPVDNQKSLPDTWIYIQERDVKVGRLQIFNNWSPYMVKHPNTVWLGMEYFCNEGDEFWNLTNEEIERTAIAELEKMGLAKVEDVLDSTVQRMEKTYPAYFGSYNQFDKIKEYTDRFENLFLVGRNGMHKYNNSDHSMLTAMVSVDNICAGIFSKANIWAINTEQEYHEENKKSNAPVLSGKNIDQNNNNINRDKQNPQGELNCTESRNSRKQNAIMPETEPTNSFRTFIFKNKRNRMYLYFATVALVIQFTVFKYFYPFASFINGDSYVYLQTAYQNLSINIYPVGYSNFLRFFSVFTKSDTILVAFQYLLLHVSILGFLFTLFYLYKPGKGVQIFLLSFLIVNPVFLYLANYISSDTLFLAISLLWFTLLFWIMHRPTLKIIIWNGLALFFAFTVRYNAMYYPLIACMAFLLSKQKWWMKVAGSTFSVLLIGLFVLKTGYDYKKLTGIWQFSPFSGWQLANNAMYAYRYVEKSDRTSVPSNLRELSNMVNTYFDTTKDLKRFPHEKLKASTVYMWTPGLPLQKYMNEYSKNDTAIKDLKRWAIVGPLYSEYGSYIIQKHPLAFLQYYIWPNTVNFYAPPIEFLEQYSTGMDSVQSIAEEWFGYKSKKIKSRFRDFDVHVLDFLPIIAGMLHIVFLFGLMGYMMFHGFQMQPWLNKAVILVTFFWILNFGFSVLASPIALRFQLFPIILSIAFASMYVEYIIKTAKRPDTKNLSQKISDMQLSG